MITSVTHVRYKDAHKAGQYVFIGRPSKWGNQFVIGLHGDRAEVIRRYEEWLLDTPEMLVAAHHELRGKVLGCYCTPSACHGDVLARVANLPVYERPGVAREWGFEGEHHWSWFKTEGEALVAAYRYEKARLEREKKNPRRREAPGLFGPEDRPEKTKAADSLRGFSGRDLDRFKADRQ
jgi:hypothetical protein